MKNNNTANADIRERAVEFYKNPENTGTLDNLKAPWEIMAAFAKSELARQSAWVKCEERLPEPDGRVYIVTVYADGSDCRNGWQSGYYVTRTVYWLVSGEPCWGEESHSGYKVIAWMEDNTPEPFQEADDER